MVKDHNFGLGSLVLMCNMGADLELASKTKPRYFGPMVVIRRSLNGIYHLVELDGAVLNLCYAAFRLIPYFFLLMDFHSSHMYSEPRRPHCCHQRGSIT